MPNGQRIDFEEAHVERHVRHVHGQLAASGGAFERINVETARRPDLFVRQIWLPAFLRNCADDGHGRDKILFALKIEAVSRDIMRAAVKISARSAHPNRDIKQYVDHALRNHFTVDAVDRVGIRRAG